jgi:hypothetical protein
MKLSQLIGLEEERPASYEEPQTALNQMPAKGEKNKLYRIIVKSGFLGRFLLCHRYFTLHPWMRSAVVWKRALRCESK